MPPIKAKSKDYGDTLTPKQELFVTEYLSNGRDSLAAYDKAYPSKNDYLAHPKAKKITKYRRDTALRMLRKNPKFIKVIKEADFKVSLRTEAVLEKYAASKERVMEELAKIAFTNTTDVVSWDENGMVVKDSKDLGDAAAAVSEVSEFETKEGKRRIKVKTADKRAALETLGKALGLFKENDKTGPTLAVQFVIQRD